MASQLIQPRTLKGFRDFMPEEAEKRAYAVQIIKSLFERYGFTPIETPAIEYLETFTGNIGEDENLFMHFTDRGDREVALRYDQTVPTCRFVAQYAHKLTFPFKRYQIQTVWRAEKPQKGRYREFLQCDADIFGIAEPEADAEVIALSLAIFEALGFPNYVARMNDRALYKSIPYKYIVAIDKLHKIGEDGVVDEMVQKGADKTEAKEMLKQVIHAEPTDAIKRIFAYLKSLGISDRHFVFDPTIARSFNYSTGPIWEVVIPEYSAGSVLGGERYDKLAGRFTNQKIPATGFAVGFDRTIDAMTELKLFPPQKSKTVVAVTVFSEELLEKSLTVTSFLRKNNINTTILAYPPFKVDKQLKYADRMNIPYAVIIGPEEAARGTVVVKNLKSRKQSEVAQEALLKAIVI